VGKIGGVCNYPHFGIEEDYMDQFACSAAGANKRSHKDFLTKFTALYDQYQAGSMDDEIVMSVIKELGEWLANHILKIDIQLNQCVLVHKAVDDLKKND
jgi:hemerythrin-like metal-binding protein